MERTPRMPEMVAPRRRMGSDLALSPSALAMRNAVVIPGRVAWERASAVRERLRRRAKEPTMPAAIPRSVAAMMTALVLKPDWRVMVSKISRSDGVWSRAWVKDWARV